MPRLFSLLTLLTVVSGAFAENWPEFRGPTGDGISPDKNVPTKFSKSEKVRWKVAIHDKGWSSPVIWGDQIWVTTGRADGKELFAVCVDRKTGTIQHDVKVFSNPSPAYCHPFNSYASPTPVIEEGRVYVHYGVHGTACLDTGTGKILWGRQDFPCNHHRGPGSSPILYKNLLILTFDGYDQQYLVAVDKTTGKTVWKKERSTRYGTTDGDYKKAYSTPSILEIHGKPQLVSPGAVATIAYEPMTGEELWQVNTGGMNESARPILAHGLIYLTSGNTQSLFAVKAGLTGEIESSGIAWKHMKEAPTRPSVIVVGELLFMVNDKGIVTCLNAKNGREIWKERLVGEFTASPVYADGNLYFCSEGGKVFVIEAADEYSLLEVNTFEDGFMASPAVADGEIFLRTKKALYCISKSGKGS